MLRTRPTLLIAIAFLLITAGTATAATKVLIKSSAQVKNGSLDAADLSAKARKSLQGKAGAAGPAGPTGAPGATGARGPSEAFLARPASINPSACPVDGCDPGATLRTLTVPAGSYLMTASAEVAPTTFVANVSRDLECHLVRQDTDTFQRTLHLYQSGATPITADQTVEVTWALTLSAPTTMSLNCAMGQVKFGAANARITALQVGALTETVS
ncbi:hypothetical protein OJ998_36495 [Solirubrobacter taibaiensis]|nr:hypothetical protein [Solirubrobacter taibaiensis]